MPVGYAGYTGTASTHTYKKDSENLVNSTPFISASIQSLLIARMNTGSMLISKVQVAEGQFDSSTNSYKTDSGSQSFPGNLYSTDRYMPVPYNNLTADIGSDNRIQKLAIIGTSFNFI